MKAFSSVVGMYGSLEVATQKMRRQLVWTFFMLSIGHHIEFDTHMSKY